MHEYEVAKSKVAYKEYRMSINKHRRASLVAQTKESACSARDLGSVPGLGRSPERGNSNPL